MLGKIFFYVSPNRDFEKIFLPSFGDFGGGGGGGVDRTFGARLSFARLCFLSGF